MLLRDALQLDLSASGQLGPTALRHALEARGCPCDNHSIDKMLRYIDTDGDGQVSLKEFADALGFNPLENPDPGQIKWG